MLEDGHLKGAVGVDAGRNTRREVRCVGLVLASHAAGEEVALLNDGVGLVTVGHNELVAHGAHGMVDDEARVLELGGVVRLGADAVLALDKHAVAAVGAAAHDPVVHAVLAHDDAAAGIGVCLEEFEQVLHGGFSSCEVDTRAKQKGRRPQPQKARGCLPRRSARDLP